MKCLVMFLLGIGLTGFVSAQVNVELRINHKLGSQDFYLNTTGQNNLGHDFQITRLQYYVSKISVVHDGAQETAISDDTIALVNAADYIYTTIELGSLNVTTVEGIKFHIGVHTPINNADPSLQPIGHPLAPQSPSMHWGWTSGYRFVALEGVSGSGFSEIMQFHALGNSNYYETEVSATGQMVMGDLIIAIDADYTEGVRSIDISSGIVSHGETGHAQEALVNFNNYVFQPASQPVSIQEHEAANQLSVYPNPSQSGDVLIKYSGEKTEVRYKITNLVGQLVESGSMLNGTAISNIQTAGQYIVSLIVDDQVVEHAKLVVN